MKLIITVDTEADNQWHSDGKLTLENIKAVPKFQALCERFDYVPTYLVTYEVIDSAEAMAILLPLERSGRAEIGTHLHPWTTPPYFDEVEEKRLMHFPSELSDASLRAKFVTQHERLTRELGYAPTAFRAGRWGLDSRVEALLREYRYEADCSVTPYVDWRRVVRGGMTRRLPNFRRASVLPSDLGSGLVELPMTILPRGWETLSTWGADMLGRGSLAVTWCRIFPETSIHELIDVYYAAESRGLPYLEFMIHSSELIRGGSPYTKTDEALEHLYATLEEFFDFLSGEDVTGITASRAAKEWKRSG